MGTKYACACFCGAVTIEVVGEPEAMGYCHCSSCRSWSAGPVNAFTLWKPQNVNVLEPEKRRHGAGKDHREERGRPNLTRPGIDEATRGDDHARENLRARRA